MKLHTTLEPVHLTLYYKGYLLLGDLHLGFEESLNKRGVLVPRFQLQDIKKQLQAVFAHLKKKKKPINTIVLVGDIKHEFGNISMQEWRETLKVIDYLKEHCNELIMIKGNHDTILYPIAEKRQVTVKESLEIGSALVIHGHEWKPEYDKTEINTIVMGHEHPAIAIREAGRQERLKCFLKGKFRDKTVIVLPSFNPLTPGTDILQQDLLSPLLKEGVENFEIFAVLEGKVDPLYFGTVQDISLDE